MEELQDLVVLEQLINALPEEIRDWVKERKPKTSEEASQLADDYVQARKQAKGGGVTGVTSSRCRLHVVTPVER